MERGYKTANWFKKTSNITNASDAALQASLPRIGCYRGKNTFRMFSVVPQEDLFVLSDRTDLMPLSAH